MLARYKRGESAAVLGEEFGLTAQGVLGYIERANGSTVVDNTNCEN
jgi:hypothetical protein